MYNISRFCVPDNWENIQDKSCKISLKSWIVWDTLETSPSKIIEEKSYLGKSCNT